jgi:superfamily I DNA and/or RNA helicase
LTSLARRSALHSGDGDEVRRLLHLLDLSQLPSLAIISPFKDVTRALNRLMARELPVLLDEHRQRSSQPTPPPGDKDEEYEKLDAVVTVGTVHTFQGQEKTAVILVLGGGSKGARQWAAGTPNLINVAVTRAKDYLYVVGDRSAWQDVGHATVLARHVLPADPDPS